MRNDLTKFKGFRSFESLTADGKYSSIQKNIKKKRCKQQRTTKEGCGNTFQWTNQPACQPENIQK